jgi:hypothetical protein
MQSTCILLMRVECGLGFGFIANSSIPAKVVGLRNTVGSSRVTPG